MSAGKMTRKRAAPAGAALFAAKKILDGVTAVPYNRRSK
jgi:hypothetical protein